MKQIVRKIIQINMLAMIFTAESAFCDSTDSTFTLPATTGMTVCPKAVINGMTVTHTDQNITFTAPDCTTNNANVAGGGGGWGYGGPVPLVFGGGGGSFTPTCTSPDYPFLGGFNEGWGGGWNISGGAGAFGMTATCCAAPQMPTMSFAYGYNPSTPTTYNTWAPAPDCP